MEYPQTLVHPHPYQILFVITVESVYLVQSLHHLTHVSQIEHVVTFGRNRQKGLRNSLVNIYGRDCQRL